MQDDICVRLFMPYYLEEQNSGTDEMPINRELIIKENPAMDPIQQ